MEGQGAEPLLISNSVMAGRITGDSNFSGKSER
jgi:hypothetical protein